MSTLSQEPIDFYEREFYVLSNFSSFAIEWKGKLWMTSEHAYHSEKFESEVIKEEIRHTRSAHDAQKLARTHEAHQRRDWQDIKLRTMADILREKTAQHPYVKKKLLETGERPLIEGSWRDAYWGIGPTKDGQNHLGKIWMNIRDEVRQKELQS